MGHGSALLAGKLYVFGGSTSLFSTPTADVIIINTTSWVVEDYLRADTNIAAGQAWPDPRTVPVFEPWDSTHIILYGGTESIQSPSPKDDLWLFDTGTILPFSALCFLITC